ncbi:unnamed protein product [marine sediment metagenome]|uniref:Uncharacterized protein n=1 Tax=marine sediment metagenome TaxID=412755 RepID=X1H5V1_9ZZZZ
MLISVIGNNGSSYNEILDIQNSFWIYTFHITIKDNIVILNTTKYDNDTLEFISYNISIFPIITINKVGLGDIKIECYLSDTQVAQTGLMIDSIGIYIDGISQSNDFGNYYYSTNKDYNPIYNNFFSLSSIGYFSCSMTSFEMSPESYVFFPYQN